MAMRLGEGKICDKVIMFYILKIWKNYSKFIFHLVNTSDQTTVSVVLFPVFSLYLNDN